MPFQNVTVQLFLTQEHLTSNLPKCVCVRVILNNVQYVRGTWHFLRWLAGAVIQQMYQPCTERPKHMPAVSVLPPGESLWVYARRTDGHTDAFMLFAKEVASVKRECYKEQHPLCSIDGEPAVYEVRCFVARRRPNFGFGFGLGAECGDFMTFG